MFCIEIKILIGVLLPVLIDFNWLEVNLISQINPMPLYKHTFRI